MGDLYRARWEIEVFFKQTLKLSGFVGYRANAIRWQVWTALLVYVLLRFAAHPSNWGTASPGSSQWCGRPCGNVWICWDYYEAMGQHCAK